MTIKWDNSHTCRKILRRAQNSSTNYFYVVATCQKWSVFLLMYMWIMSLINLVINCIIALNWVELHHIRNSAHHWTPRFFKSFQAPSTSATHCSYESTGLTRTNKMKHFSFKYVVANCQTCELNSPTCSASFSYFVMFASVGSFEGCDSRGGYKL